MTCSGKKAPRRASAIISKVVIQKKCSAFARLSTYLFSHVRSVRCLEGS